jgi:hypothetical protein
MRTKLTKWYTLGRVSHELAYVMPNNRTVYTTDDHPNGGGATAVHHKRVLQQRGEQCLGI